MMYAKKRSLFEVFSPSVKKLWNESELRVLIMLSLSSQILLIVLGNRRKYNGRTWIRFCLWSAYLMSDWFAAVALGVISHNYLQDSKGNPLAVDKELMSFWAPFLLLHLGGPDTITAYSFEDNQLWLRHLLGLVVQTLVAMYIFLMAWPGESWLPLLSIVVLKTGIIKYGERTWSLRSANTENFRESMLTRPDPGPNYAKFMEEFTLKKAEGFRVGAAAVYKQAPVPADRPHDYNDRELLLKVKAHELFETFKCLFVDLILSFQDRDNSQIFFKDLTSDEAFHVIEIELGFAFDVFYTKAPVVYTRRGCILRITSFCSTFSVLVAFVFLIESKKYHQMDLIITYLLLVVAVIIETYSVILMLSSDWTECWRKPNSDFLFNCLPKLPKEPCWSNSIAQYNLLDFCLRDKSSAAVYLGIFQRLLQIDELEEKHRYKTYNNVSAELKSLVFKFFKEYTNKDIRALWTHRGSYALKKHKCTKLLDWSITKVEFDQSILIWHIATDLCYYTDEINTATPPPPNVNSGGNVNSSGKEKEISKHISDYMSNLLVMCPFMLPIGIGKIRFQDTCAEAGEFFRERGLITGGKDETKKAQACKKLLQVNTEVEPIKVKGDRSKSVLFDACRLAMSLRDMKEEKWKVVSHVWVEMLAYAATQCRGNHHAHQLRKGGEFLTHVWLLMAHLGITEQLLISEGHARAKLVVK